METVKEINVLFVKLYYNSSKWVQIVESMMVFGKIYLLMIPSNDCDKWDLCKWTKVFEKEENVHTEFDCE